MAWKLLAIREANPRHYGAPMTPPERNANRENNAYKVAAKADDRGRVRRARAHRAGPRANV